jgi:hypothetical protein
MSGRTIEYHRAQIRGELGFRVANRGDEAKLTRWLAEEVAPSEPSDRRLTELLLARCRTVRIEPPGRLERIVAAARAAAAETFCARTLARLPEAVAARLEALVDGDGTQGPEPALAELRSGPGRVSLASLLAEIAKLEGVRALGLPPDLFAGVHAGVIAAWRARAGVEYPSDLRGRARPLRLTLLGVLRWCRAAS